MIILISYLKPYYCVQIICISLEYLVSYICVQKTKKTLLNN